MSDLTQERLRELLHYDPDTGIFTWLVTHHRICVGDRAGYINRSGCQPWRYIMIDQRGYRASRLAWFYMTGEWPVPEIDHRDRNPINDAWDNLHLATSTQNSVNQRMRRDNRSGFKGVHPYGTRFIARTRINGKYLHLGIFNTAEEAAAEYNRVRLTAHGEYAL
jgi:hypothetical protein